MTASGTQFCFNVNRKHTNQHVILSVDLVRGVAYQRCWSLKCGVEAAAGSASARRLKAKHRIGRPPAASLPSHDELETFERNTDPRLDQAGTGAQQ